MKNRIIKTLAKSFVLLILLSTLSSCGKKGYGCPYDLKAPISFTLPISK